MKQVLIKLLASALVIISASVNAAIINSDYISLNDGLAVYDESTGLTWLDLSVTAGMTIAEAESQFTGFTLASNEQTTTLFANFENNVSDMDMWYALFGSSESHEPGVSVGAFCNWDISCSYGVDASDKIFGYGVNNGNVGYYANAVPNDPLFVLGVALFFVSDDFQEPSSNGGNSVPEPSTLFIFALGMIGLAWRRLSRKS